MGAARVGDLVAIRTRDHGHVFACVVRWVRSEQGENLEIGLQQMAGRFEPASFRRVQGRHYGQIPVLVAPLAEPAGRCSVLAPSRLLGVRHEVLISRSGREARYVIRRIVESTTLIDLVEAEEVRG